RLGLIRKDADGVHDMFRARLMFPIRDVQGRVIAFGGRVLDTRLPKYLNSPESPLYSKTRTLYGLYESRQGIAARDRAILVEGYIDAIALWQAGFKEVVAGCGTALTVDQLRILTRHTRNVLACFDGDDAGRKASLRALEIFLEAGLLGRAIFIPPGFDPDTFVKDRGAQAFAELADRAELLIDFFIAGQAEQASQSLESRARAAVRVAEVLRRVQNSFEFDLLARKAAPLLGVSEDLLRREGRASRPASWRERNPAPAAPRAESRPSDAGARAEIGLVALALLCPELRAELLRAIEPPLFDSAELASTLEEICASDASHAPLEGFIAERLSAAEQSQIAELAVGTSLDVLAHARVLMNDFVGALARRRRVREVDSLRREAQSGAASEDDATAAAQAVIALRRSSSRA
ncbi:MAG TPA: toprim domain-containing protein, partial [Candidatus Binataceae bacterium]|nr:toprim domain-containing protein [Candidatus Binataceae bacterium]